MDPNLISMYKELFEGKIQKKLILDEKDGVVFNPGAYKDDTGDYYIYARTSTHHINYTSWIRLYRSRDGLNFTKQNEFFIYPPYTLEEYIYGIEDDRCTRIENWWVHTHSTLLAKNTESPSRKEYIDYIGISLGKSSDKAVSVGIVDISHNKNSTLIGAQPWLIHRPMNWTQPPCVWYGDFQEGFEEAKKNYARIQHKGIPYERLVRITPPKNNKILLAPLEKWGVFKIGLGAQPVHIEKFRFLFTVHIRSIPYQYWITAGILKITEQNEIEIEKLLPCPICIPDTPLEIIGDVPKVCFICGATTNANKFEGWYGAADTRIMKFEIDFDYLVNTIETYGITQKEISEIIKEYVMANREYLKDNILVDKVWLEKMC